MYSKTVLINSRFYKPTVHDLKGQLVNEQVICRTLPTCDPTNDGEALGYKTHLWDETTFKGKAFDWIDPHTSAPGTYICIIKTLHT